jgi:hypothetical protein
MNGRRLILFGLIIFRTVIGLQAAAKKKKCEFESEDFETRSGCGNTSFKSHEWSNE